MDNKTTAVFNKCFVTFNSINKCYVNLECIDCKCMNNWILAYNIHNYF